MKVKGIKMKKKTVLQFKKNVFSLLLFLGWSFGFAFQRWFVELEKAPIKHFKSLKMEKNWERYVKVFGHRKVFDDGPVYVRFLGSKNMSPINVNSFLGCKPNDTTSYSWKKYLTILHARQQRAPTFQLVPIYLPTHSYLPTYLPTACVRHFGGYIKPGKC